MAVFTHLARLRNNWAGEVAGFFYLKKKKKKL